MSNRLSAGLLAFAKVWAMVCAVSIVSAVTGPAHAAADQSIVVFPRFHSASPRKEPVYPSELKKRRICGIVGVQLFVGTDGNVTKSRVAMSSGHPELDELALKETADWKLSPGQVAGKATAMWGTFTVTYSIVDEGVPMPDQEEDLAELAEKVDRSREELEAGTGKP